MPVIDAQIHEPAPWSDWTGEPGELPDRILNELVSAYLDAVGVDKVILFPADERWGAAAVKALPERFAYVPHISPDEPDVEAAVRAAKARHPQGQLAVRAVIGWPDDGSEVRRLEAGGWDPVFAACERHRLPVFTFISGFLPLAAKIAERFPDLTLIIDHIGLRQPPMDEPEDPLFKSLPQLLDLARFPKVAVKLCGVPALSREAYPFDDVVPHLRAIVDAFGADRIMWASDTTRFGGRMALRRMEIPRALKPYPGKHSYAEALLFIRESPALSAEEKQAILGGTVQRLLGWPS
jgi:predicted TIM-barrel fold metal-dependent hydrolase